jgi:hypothetical protein
LEPGVTIIGPSLANIGTRTICANPLWSPMRL